MNPNLLLSLMHIYKNWALDLPMREYCERKGRRKKD
jgi:hypothetical protein